MNFYRCRHCGNIITKLHDSGVQVVCCGEEMELLTPNTIEASFEKHIPVIRVEGNQVMVSVGSEPHPMEASHYIEWICLQTDNGFECRYLQPGMMPEVMFCLANNQYQDVYAYCNLHGLWKVSE